MLVAGVWGYGERLDGNLVVVKSTTTSCRRGTWWLLCGDNMVAAWGERVSGLRRVGVVFEMLRVKTCPVVADR